MDKLFANSGYPDQTPHSAASGLGLHCLPSTLLRISRLQHIYSRINHESHILPGWDWDGVVGSGGKQEASMTPNTQKKLNSYWDYGLIIYKINYFIFHKKYLRVPLRYLF